MNVEIELCRCFSFVVKNPGDVIIPSLKNDPIAMQTSRTHWYTSNVLGFVTSELHRSTSSHIFWWQTALGARDIFPNRLQLHSRKNVFVKHHATKFHQIFLWVYFGQHIIQDCWCNWSCITMFFNMMLRCKNIVPVKSIHPLGWFYPLHCF